MQSFEIYNATRVWRGCTDMRPWLVIDVNRNGSANCFPITGQNYGGRSFELRMDHHDFHLTGLSKACYVPFDILYEVSAAAFGRRRGTLAGSLLEEFRFFADL